MYITCEQCSTIFRLDENLLKPTGSKVRCSQCFSVFVTKPPETVESDMDELDVAAAFDPDPLQQDSFDKELEDIDISELDSLLEQGQTPEAEMDSDYEDALGEIEEPIEFDENDLDMDFESALEKIDEELSHDDVDSNIAFVDKDAAENAEQALNDSDLDMDFELDDMDEITAQSPDSDQSPDSESELLESDLEMDFSLEEITEEPDEKQPTPDAEKTVDLPREEEEAVDLPLTDDVELALDDFEDVLGDAVGTGDGAIEHSDTEEELTLGLAPDVTGVGDKALDDGDTQELETAGASSDVDFGDFGNFDALLDEDDDAPEEDDDKEELELSLDNEVEVRAAQQDIDLDLKADMEDEEQKVVIAPEQQAGDDLDLASLDMMLDDDDDDDDDEATIGTEPEEVELSLSDNDAFSLDSDTGFKEGSDLSAGTVSFRDSGESDDLDLSSLDELLDEDAVPSNDAPSDDDMELSLADDTELSLDEPPDTKIKELSEASDSDSDEFDLSEFEDMLSEDSASPKAEGQPPSKDGESPDALSGGNAAEGFTEESFDLSDLDPITEDEETSEDSESEDIELSLDDGFDLSLDGETLIDKDSASFAADTDSSGEEEDFDLSSLGDDLLGEDASEEKSSRDGEMALSLDDDMQLSLDEETDLEVTSDAEVGDDIGELEGLDFELDAEYEDKPISKASEPDIFKDEIVLEESPQDDGELDLTDIEQMLEDDNIVPETGAVDAKQVPGTDGGEKWNDGAGDGLALSDEFDLSEIEEAIDNVDDSGDEDSLIDDAQELEFDIEPEQPKSLDEAEELELELEMDGDSGLKEKSLIDEDDEALDLSDLDLSMEDEHVVETETVDAGDIQLEFQLEESGGERPESIAEEVGTTTGFLEGDDDFSVDDTIATEPFQDQAEIGAEEAPKKGGANNPLIIVASILLFLIFIGFFGYRYAVNNDLKIPFLSGLMKSEVKDPKGTMQLATLEVNSKFIDNNTSGRLFVISGKVRNSYPTARKLIQLRGKLFTKDKELARTENTYAGLVMADNELSTKSIEEIKEFLTSTTGQDAAVTIEAGMSAPFMVVFAELPSDLDEFIIEFVSSTGAQ